MGLRRHSHEVLALAIIISLVVGYFIGREHLKYQIALGLQKAFRVFSGVTPQDAPTNTTTTTTTTQPTPREIPGPIDTGPFDFRKTRWGMNKDDVKKSEGMRPEGENENFIMYRDTISDMHCMLGYLFIGDKLIKAQYTFDKRPTNPIDYFVYYDNILMSLISIYGKPEIDEIKWKDDTFRNKMKQWGDALVLGHVFKRTRWNTKAARITLYLYEEQREINFNIEYLSIKYMDLWNSHIHDKAKKNL